MTSPTPPADPTKQKPGYLNFVFGGIAGMGAACIVQPLNLVKTRMQIQGTGAKRQYANSIDCIRKVVKIEGPLAIYNGIGASLLRQATYTTGRLGVYTSLNDAYLSYVGHNANLLFLMGIGGIAGAFGAFIGTPAELVLIRMTADGCLPINERRNYKNIVNALTRITSEEGFTTLWRGCIPTMVRAVVVNMVQLASYTYFKNLYMTTFDMKEGIKTHLCASMTSGFLTTFTSMPVDIAKTRIQNMKIINGKPQYTGALNVIITVSKYEGIHALWKGCLPYFCRLGPHTVLTFIFLEQLNRLYKE